jgi:hypothetical protein
VRRFVPFLVAIGLLTATSAHAQFGKPPEAPPPPREHLDPTDQIDIVGVIQQIGPEPDRVTIAYDAVDALGWPPGQLPFVVAKADLLKGLTVGEKVRFRLESQQIADIGPYRERKPVFGPAPVLPQPPPAPQ